MLVLTLTCVFRSFVYPFIINGLANRFNFVTSENNMLVHFINVGQADAIAINLPDGKTMLIDDGSKDYNVNYVKYLKENVTSSKLNNKIDYLVLTHADSDHVGGTMKLLKNFEIKTIFMPKIMSNSQTFSEIYNYVTKNCDYKTLGDEFKIETKQYKFTFFELLNDSNTNDSSQVIKLEYRNKSFLFTGDISTNVEDDYLNIYGEKLDCDVLKIAHHGSKTATSEAFLHCVTPNYAIISVGKNNDYNHPNDSVIKLLNDYNVNILRTDEHGDILFVIGKDYNLKILNNKYYITNLTLDYTIYVLVFDIILFGVAIVVIIKKEKKKSKHRSKDFLV